MSEYNVRMSAKITVPFSTNKLGKLHKAMFNNQPIGGSMNGGRNVSFTSVGIVFLKMGTMGNTQVTGTQEQIRTLAELINNTPQCHNV